MRSPLIPLFAASLLLLPPSAAAFCEAPQPRLVCAEFFSGPLIVQATLVRTSHEAETQDQLDAYIYSLRVNRVLRGKASQTIRVYEENSSGRATFNWVPRTDYLLFLFPLTEKKGMWALDGCGNSGPVSNAAEALAEIAKVKASVSGGGMIQGVVNGPHFAATQPSSGMHVAAKGASGLFSAVTNKDGEFRMDVPAGRYVVSVNEPGLSFRPFEFTYEDPDALQIQPGGCAQVQFVDSQR
jgi:hypothetical protein